MRSKITTETCSISFKKAQLAKLRQLAEARETSVSMLVREAVRNYLWDHCVDEDETNDDIGHDHLRHFFPDIDVDQALEDLCNVRSEKDE